MKEEDTREPVRNELGKALRRLAKLEAREADRKQMEEALRESEERFRRLAENAQDLIYRYELSPLPRFTYVSPAARVMTGYTPAQYYADPDLFFKLPLPPDRPLVEAAARGVIPPGNLLTLRWVRKDGRILWTEQRIVPIYDAAANLVAIEGIARDITERKQMEEALRESSEHLRSLATRLADVEEAERRQLARELHDRLGQNLTAVNINLSMIRSLLCGKSGPDIDARLGDCLKLLEETMDCTRDLMAELRPPVMDDYGLLASLQWYGKRLSHNTGVTVVVEGNELTPRLPPSMEISLFRVAQEAMTNVAKHAHATQVTVTLENTGEAARLIITDNGNGFDPTQLSRPTEGRGWGLMFMRERMEGVGAAATSSLIPGRAHGSSQKRRKNDRKTGREGGDPCPSASFWSMTMRWCETACASC